jgi:5-methyltetrahydropteroyltriglutamate--homocysteine methyltransferase
MALLTTTIGSFPKPPALHEARRRFAEGGIEAGALLEVENEATVRALRFQEDLGLDLLVDGEMDRADPITTFAERLSGVEIAGWVRVYGDRYVRKPRIVGPVGRAGASTVERFRFARGAASRDVKAVVPGPYSLLDGSYDEHYASRRAACAALAEVVRDEVRDLAAAGATDIQIDEPAAGARTDELPMLAELLAHVGEPVRGRARLWVYLGYADLEGAGAALAKLPADGVLVAAAHCDYAGIEGFARALPSDRFVGVGVIDTLRASVESEEEVRARIARLRELIPSDRLWVVPDGGFRALRPDAARAKLSAMVRAAK